MVLSLGQNDPYVPPKSMWGFFCRSEIQDGVNEKKKIPQVLEIDKELKRYIGSHWIIILR